MEGIYLDSAASARQKKIDYKQIPFGNPNSTHMIGRSAKALLEDSRDNIANYFNINPHGVIFTATATEANNLFANSFNKVLSSISEHPSLSECKNVFPNISVDKTGVIDFDEIAIAKELKNDFDAISIIHMNNETGIIFDYKNFNKIQNVIKHSDCSQSLNWFNIKDIFDYTNAITISSHKCGGPFGAAALVVDDKILKHKLLKSLIKGGGQEYQHRSGTQNVNAVSGFEKALIDSQENVLKIYSNAKECEKTLLEILKQNEIDFEYIGLGANKSPSIMSIWIKNCSAQELQTMLDFNGVYISLGSACKSGAMTKSPILSAMGLPNNAYKETIRISFGWDTKVEEVKEAAKIIVDCIKKIS